MRSGTVPTHLCVGLGAACSLAQQEIRYLLSGHLAVKRVTLWNISTEGR